MVEVFNYGKMFVFVDETGSDKREHAKVWVCSQRGISSLSSLASHVHVHVYTCTCILFTCQYYTHVSAGAQINA